MFSEAHSLLIDKSLLVPKNPNLFALRAHDKDEKDKSVCNAATIAASTTV